MIAEADVSNEEEVKDLISRTVEKFGRVDVLVNNAGVVAGGDVGTLTTDDWRRVMATDVDGVFYASRAALPHLKASRGSIVNVSSVSGMGGDWDMAAYNAAKGAVTNLTRAMGYGPRERRSQGECSVPKPDTDRHDRGHDGRRQADCEVQ
jgi:meso-butanediol dehydrogenase/(S,S)-butanediol dehydrogenase/diacetyl reductase